MRDLAPFVDRLAAGDDLVLGSRFEGTIHGEAMPWLNRRIGNPILTGLLNVLFGVKVSDAHCGMRAVRRDALPALDLHSTGHGVRLGDGLQGLPPQAPRQRDPDRLLPARRRVEAQPLRRRVAPRAVHAPLQPELAVLRARASSCCARDRRGIALAAGPGHAPRAHVADPLALRSASSRDRCSARRSSSSGSSRSAFAVAHLGETDPLVERARGRLTARARLSRGRHPAPGGLGLLARDLRRLGDRRLRRAVARVRDRTRLHARRAGDTGRPRLVLPRPLDHARRPIRHTPRRLVARTRSDGARRPYAPDGRVRICLVYDHLFRVTVGGGERWMRDLAARRRRRARGDLFDDAPLGRRAAGSSQASWSSGLSPAGDVYAKTAARSAPRSGSGSRSHAIASGHGGRFDVVHTAAFPYFPLLGASVVRRRRRYRLVGRLVRGLDAPVLAAVCRRRGRHRRLGRSAALLPRSGTTRSASRVTLSGVYWRKGSVGVTPSFPACTPAPSRPRPPRVSIRSSSSPGATSRKSGCLCSSAALLRTARRARPATRCSATVLTARPRSPRPSGSTCAEPSRSAVAGRRTRSSTRSLMRLRRDGVGARRLRARRRRSRRTGHAECRGGRTGERGLRARRGRCQRRGRGGVEPRVHRAAIVKAVAEVRLCARRRSHGSTRMRTACASSARSSS